MKKTFTLLTIALAVVMALAMLAGCAPASDPAKAQSALKDKGYVVTKVDNSIALAVTEKLLGLESGDLTATVSGTKTDDNKNVQTITIWYFKDSAAAKRAWEKAQSYAEDQKKDEDSDWVVKKSGKMIYYGTSQAVKDAR